MKKVLSFMIAVCMAVSWLPVSGWAAEAVSQDGQPEEGAVLTLEDQETNTAPKDDAASDSTAPAKEQGAAEEADAAEAEQAEEQALEEVETVVETARNTVEEPVTGDAPETDEIADGGTESGTVDSELPDSDDLFAAYVNRAFGFEEEEPPRRRMAVLDKPQKAIYDYLAIEVEKVASGDRSSTQFEDEEIKAIQFTAADLGLTTLVSNGELSQVAKDALKAKVTTTLRMLFAKMPYEFYWFDKTAGWTYSMTYYTSGRAVWLTSISFYVSADYSQNGSEYTLCTDTDKTSATVAAVEKADSVVAQYEALSDYNKLTAYKNWICGEVSYNHDAAYGNDHYGDPWQLISVFDEDAETNVVCEGYSKAFQYLCDHSTWVGPVSVICAQGYMDGGPHMWNIVTIGGANYMADVTNSDEGSSGWNGQLFLTGASSGSAAEGYTFSWSSFKIGDRSYPGSTIQYVYDDTCTSVFDEELELSMTDYQEDTAHVDADHNTVCDDCGTKVGSVVRVTSSGNGGVDGATMSLVSGGGIYYDPDLMEGGSLEVVLRTVQVNGYRFRGWYSADDSALAECLSTATTYQFTASGQEDYSLVAVYEPNGDDVFTLAVSGSAYTVSGVPGVSDDETQNGDFIASIPVNTSITVTFTGPETFQYWANGSGMIVAADKKTKAYTFTLVSDTTLVSYYAEDTESCQANLMFISGSQVLSSQQIYYNPAEPEQNTAITYPSVPGRVGNVFTHWALKDGSIATEEAIRAAVAGSGGLIKVYPVFTPNGKTYHVTTNYVLGSIDGTALMDAAVSPEQAVGNCTTVSAPETIEDAGTAYTFSYWSNAAGGILGYTTSYTVRPTSSVTLYAVYGVSNVTSAPAISMTDAFASQAQDKYKISFTATRSVPDEYTVLKTGIMYTTNTLIDSTDDDYLKELMVLGADANKVVEKDDSSTANNSTMTLNINSKHNDRVFYARGFVVVSWLDGNGASQSSVFYSDNILSGSYLTLS